MRDQGNCSSERAFLGRTLLLSPHSNVGCVVVDRDWNIKGSSSPREQLSFLLLLALLVRSLVSLSSLSVVSFILLLCLVERLTGLCNLLLTIHSALVSYCGPGEFIQQSGAREHTHQ